LTSFTPPLVGTLAAHPALPWRLPAHTGLPSFPVTGLPSFALRQSWEQSWPSGLPSAPVQPRRHRERDLIRRLERLTGQTVTLKPAAGQEPAA
jgi:hypothetical protein